YSAGGDFNFYNGAWNTSAGMLVINDRSGANLNVSKILPSFALHRKILGFQVHAGLQPGIVIKSYDFYKNTYPNQFNWSTGQYENTLPNFEKNVQQNFTILDVSAGLGLSRRFGKIEPELSYAWFHLNKPKESFLQQNNQLPVRQMANVILRYYAGKHLILEGHSMYGYTSDVSNWVSGLNAEIVLQQNPLYRNSFFVGVMWRNGMDRNPDSGIITAGIRYMKYTLGFSYDITISELKTSVDAKGAFEVALIYKAFNNKLQKREINCERY
ncbi:MAG TPA: hypothetical protein PLQ93_13490, partial [Bacteroidia bacterium]|nr:hypothetical protein [Bacteroidia bacterium]